MNAYPRRLTCGLRRAAAVAALAVTLAGAPAGVAIAAPRAASTTAQGTTLVKRFFDLLTKQDKGGLQKFLSPAFQLQGADGGFLDKRALVANPSQVESYELSELRATRSGDVIVVRYDVKAVVTINGVPQARDPAARLSVFVRAKKGWQMIAHANFNVPLQTNNQ